MKRLILVMFILLLPAVAPLMRSGYFTMHDDLQAMRQLEMNKCFNDKQIPCRWVLDMGYGYGYPLFNYYPPLPYYFGQVVHWLGWSYTDTVKVMGIIGFAASVVAMYLLAKEFWGKQGGVVAAMFYLYAPYHSTDFYVRAAVNEFWALVFYPLIYWTTYRLVKDGVKWIPWITLSVAGLMLSHNPMLMIFVPTYLLWILLWLIKFKSVKAVGWLAICAGWAFGLAAFFTLPVIFEAKFVSIWTLTSGYFNYLAHFVDWRQILLKMNWGYGSSVFGPEDTMSFAVGYLHWLIPLIVLFAAIAIKRLRHYLPVIIFGLVIMWGSMFMMHWKATPLWLKIKPLEFLQFPWRFLTLTIFAASFVAGVAALVIPRKWNAVWLAALLTLLLALNANYFRPRQWLPNISDANKFQGHLWQLQLTNGIFDYLPIYAPFPPADGKSENLTFVSGEGLYKTEEFKTNYQQFQVQASTSATLEIQTYYFPGWRVWLDKLEVPIDPKRDPLLGRMQVDVAEGDHEIIVRFMQTPLRLAADSLSLIAWAALILYFIPWPGSRNLHLKS